MVQEDKERKSGRDTERQRQREIKTEGDTVRRGSENTFQTKPLPELHNTGIWFNARIPGIRKPQAHQALSERVSIK